MRYDLDKTLEKEIIDIAERNGIKKLILFGSRARGDNTERSDIDLAVSGGNAAGFYYEAENAAHTLLMFDVVDLDKKITSELRSEINRDGVIIYEKA